MTCEDYLQDPEANAAHLASCAACRAVAEALVEELSAPLADAPARPIALDALPLAPWEGASHRTWPLVAAGVAAMLILATVLFVAAGVSSIGGVANAMVSEVPPVEGLLKFFMHTGTALGAPIVAVLFIAINTILFLLLRRAPKGFDV
jgi:hypothetical protein